MYLRNIYIIYCKINKQINDYDILEKYPKNN